MSTFYDDWAEVTPGPGEPVHAVAELLLKYADDVTHVRTIRSGNAFLVHPSVIRKYNGARKRRTTRKGDDE